MVASAPDGTNGSGGGSRPPFECIALLLQGGGALGSYQAGVYEALAEAGLHPDWVAGISIGAINSSLIAGNPPGRRVEKLRAFWEAVSDSLFNTPPSLRALPVTDDYHRAINQIRAFEVLLFGTPHFFTPRIPHPMLLPSSPVDAVSHYDTAPLRATLLELVDFDLLNSGSTRLSVGAVNVKSGNFVSFDNTTHRIGPEHIMASGALPPGFPATEVDGEYFWDGGLVSNTPLQWVFDARPRQDTLAFQVDLWSARGELPRNLIDAEVRQKEIQFSSRTRAGTNHVKRAQRLRQAFTNVVRQLPAEMFDMEDVKLLRGGGGRQGLQHRSPDLSLGCVRRNGQGLRVLPPDHGGALAGRIPGRGSRVEASGGDAASRPATRCPDLRLRHQRTGRRGDHHRGRSPSPLAQGVVRDESE